MFWVFGNLYEAIVDVPQLLADARPQQAPRLQGTWKPNPLLHPYGTLTLAATTAAPVDSWRAGGDRRRVITAAASTASATALSAYLI